MSTVAEQIAELQEQVAKQEEALREAREVQYLEDMRAYVRLNEEYGFGRTIKIELLGWKPGLPALIVARLPESRDASFKRFKQQILAKDPRASEKVEAENALGLSCIVYPEKGSELHANMLAMAEGVLANAAAQVVHAVQGRAAEEGK